MAHYHLAVDLGKKGLWDEAVFHYHQTVQLEPDDIKFLVLPVRLGGSYFPPRHWDKAITAFSEITRSHPQSAWCNLHLGWALQHRERWEESLPLLQLCVKLEPTWFFAHYHLGRAYHQTGQLDLAIAAYEEALRQQIGPSEREYSKPGGFHGARARYFLGRALQQQGRYDEAILRFEQAIPLKRYLGFEISHPHPHFTLAAVLAEAQYWDRAVEAYWNAIDWCRTDFDPGPWMVIGRNDELFTRLKAKRPNDRKPQLMRARAFAFERNWQRAIDEYTRLRPKTPGGHDQIFEYACLLLLLGDHDAYQKLLTDELKRGPDKSTPVLRFWRVRLAVITQESNVPNDQMVTWAEQSISDKPHLDRLQILALAHYRAGQFDQAIKRAEQSCTKPWSGAMANLPLLAMAHHRLGHVEQAHRILREAHDERSMKRQEFGTYSSRAREFLIFEILLREAEALLGIEKKTSENRRQGSGFRRQKKTDP